MFLDFSQLDGDLLNQYRYVFNHAFPEVIFQSEVVGSCWTKVEQYFPDFQRILIGSAGQLIGFINTLPLKLDVELGNLPAEGWDWLMQKGISDFEDGSDPNCLGGLQVVVAKEHQGKGFSKTLIVEGQRIQRQLQFRNFIIPIRPTLKHKHPKVSMLNYLKKQENDKIYDPWIRTHVKTGAKIIGVCSKSMHIQAKLSYWEKLLDQRITETGDYQIPGALNLVRIDIETGHGEYLEENIWINHPLD
ncbi:MAG: hypothetical protein HKN87_02535 [Saprospiraceae bacterium]|nr:hypothetical protein [Saprospiraceae bacterium]